MKFCNLSIFQGLKLRISMGKILSISLILNFTPGSLGCYGLKTSCYYVGLFGVMGGSKLSHILNLLVCLTGENQRSRSRT